MMGKILRGAVLFLLLAGPVSAQDTTSGHLPWPTGLRVGYTSWDAVSQMHFGLHSKLGDLFPNVQLTPSLETGFGDDLTLVTLNGDLSYRFTEIASYPWEIYGGGGLALNYTNPAQESSDFQLGLNLVAGFSKALDGGDEILMEARFGILDSPDFKLTCGYTFF